MLNRILANWPLKLLAVGLAFAIWVSVTGESRIVQDIQVPLEFRLPDDLVVASPLPTTVTVRLRGVESLMRRLDPVPMVLRVDLDQVPPGDHEVLLAKDQLHGVPRGIDVDFISPDRVTITVDRRARRLVSVEPTLLGQPADGYTLYGVTVTPDALPVEGPESQVRNLEVLRTSPVRLDQRSAPFTAHVGVVPEGPQLRVLDPRPVEVRVVVDETAVERRLDHVPVQVVGTDHPVTVSPSTLNVTLTGPSSLVESLKPDQVRLVADGSGIEPDQGVQRVDVHVEFVNVSPGEQARLGVKAISQQRVAVRVREGGDRS